MSIRIVDEVGIAVYVSKDMRNVRIVAADAPNEPRDDETPIIRLGTGGANGAVPLLISRKARHLQLGGC